MFGCNHHVRGTEQRVRPRGVDPQHVVARPPRVARGPAVVEPAGIARFGPDVEIDFRPRAAADPLPLHRLDAVRPGQLVEVSLQSVRVRGDPQHPLPQRNPLHRVPAPLAPPVDDFLVRQDRTQRGAPIHQGFGLVGQTMFVLVAAHGRRTLPGDLVRDGKFGDRSAPLLLGVEPGVKRTRKIHCVQRK